MDCSGVFGKGDGTCMVEWEGAGGMTLGREVEEWFPDIMRVTEKRWKKAKAKNLLDALDD
jgi:hypothetical protein